MKKQEMRKRGNEEMTITICSFFNIVPSRYLDSFGQETVYSSYRTIYDRTLLNKERTHSYLDLEQCNLRHVRVLLSTIDSSF